jgi:hypothetical protein
MTCTAQANKKVCGRLSGQSRSPLAFSTSEAEAYLLAIPDCIHMLLLPAARAGAVSFQDYPIRARSLQRMSVEAS